MGSRYHPRLASWFDTGLNSGRFDVPNGRHIVLNEFPRLMKESRLVASAGVDAGRLREFLLDINPNIVTIADGSPEGLRLQLASEKEQLPALRKAFVPEIPAQWHECWFIYTPPLDVMRQSWRNMRPSLGLTG